MIRKAVIEKRPVKDQDLNCSVSLSSWVFSSSVLCESRCCRGGHDIMVDLAARLEELLPQCEIDSFCRRWKIHELSLFGSVHYSVAKWIWWSGTV
jgi:hypothetical protein